MKKLKMLTAALAVLMFGAVVLAPVPVGAAYDPLSMCDDPANATNEICKNRKDGASDLIKNLVNALLFVVGALSVIMIIVAGILYTTSAGDSNKVSRAKNTLTYSIVGLAVSFLAYAIVNWVLKLF